MVLSQLVQKNQSGPDGSGLNACWCFSVTSSGEQGVTANVLAFPIKVPYDGDFARRAAPHNGTIRIPTSLLPFFAA